MTQTVEARSGEREAVEAALARVLATPHIAELDAREAAAVVFDAGLAWVFAPQGCGGLGVDRRLQSMAEDAIELAGLPITRRAGIGHGIAAPTLIEHGSQEQLGRFLRPLYLGDEQWCQLFSEPGGGSDLAALSTRAEWTGGEWEVSGQKVWTSGAHAARWGIILARTDPTVPKHAGLSFFVMDMHAKGVEVRRLRQMTGAAEFNEVFFDKVRLGDELRVGRVGEGWEIALTTLSNERRSIGSKNDLRAATSLTQLLEAWLAAEEDAVVTDRTIACWIQGQLNEMLKQKLSTVAAEGGLPSARAALGKLAFAETIKETYDTTVELMAYDGICYPQGRDGYDSHLRDTVDEYADPRMGLLRALGNSIGGGTSEILRSVIGERVLGLPPEPRVDKTIPWNETRRN